MSRALALILLVGWLVMRSVAAQPAAFVSDGAGVPFFPFAVQEDALSGAPDMSSLNLPIGAADRAVVHSGHFWKIGADGQPGTADDERLRLYGVNLTFAANFPSTSDAVRMARRLRRLGFNAVRLHHLDTAPDTRSDPPRSVLLPGPFPTFNPVALERLRGFIEVLAREGIYVDLNLRVGFRFRPDVDRVPPLDGDSKAAPLSSPLFIYNARMADLQESYARQLIKGLELRGRASLAMVEVSNEASLLGAWQRREWQAAVPTAYAPELTRLWQQWVERHHGSAAAACKAWNTCAGPDGPIDLLVPRDADMAAPAVVQWRQRIENWLRAWWRRIFGTPALDDSAPVGTALRTSDFLRFLADTDRHYFDRMRRVVHEETDAAVPVTGTQMGYGGVLNFDSHQDQDYIDEHFYIDHPDFPGADWDRHDWRIRDLSASSGEQFDRMLALSFRRDSRKPFVVSEYSQPFPSRQGADAAPLLAAVAAQQDWDGLFLFDYMDGDTWSDAPTGFTLAGDWGKYALVGAAARAFRTPLVVPLPQTMSVTFPAATRLSIAAAGEPNGLDNWLRTRHAVGPEMALQRRMAMVLGDSLAAVPDRPGAPSPAGATGALVADRQRGTVMLQAPQLCGFFGQAGTGTRLGDATASVEIAQGGRGSVGLLLSSLDNQPVASARRLLVSIGGAVRGTQPGSQPARPTDLVPYRGDRTWWTFEPDGTAPGSLGGSRDTRGPVWIERVPLQLRFATTGSRATVFPLDGSGRRLAALDGSQVRLSAGTLEVDLQARPAQASPWYEVAIE